MARWVAQYFYPETGESERKDESNRVATSTTSAGGPVASLFSGLWSRGDTPADSTSPSESALEHRALEGQERQLDKSRKDVNMAELKPIKVNFMLNI